MTDVQLKEIKEFIEENGYECIYVANPKGDFLFIDTYVNGDVLRLKCTFPLAFPYEFPKVSILEEFYKKYKPLPHVDNKGGICTFDSNKVFPNKDKPKEMTLEVIKQAIKIIEDGINRINIDDFRDEFTSYWGLDSDIVADVIFTPTDSPAILIGCRPNNNYLYIAEGENKLKDFVQITKRFNFEKSKIFKVLYLPIEKEFTLPFPKTNSEMINFIKDTKYYDKYLEFLKDNSSPRIILFSQNINGSLCVEGWKHEKRKTPNGFRNNNINPIHLYKNLNGEDKIIKIRVNQLDHTRTFTRGGDGHIKNNIKVSITGCGSIGSNLVKNLIDIGVKDFFLIDNETLSVENIARHYCGASYLRTLKVDAIKNELIRHYADINCDVYAENVFNLLKEDLTIFNECDYNFVVVGGLPIERKFIELFNSGQITKPIILVWVEPYLMGGHAVLLQEKANVEKYLYDKNFNFKHRIILNGDEYVSREAGCESTYLPYSAFEVQYFLTSLIDFMNIKIFEKSIKGNYLLSWSGRLDKARKNKMKINSSWISSNGREMRVKSINELE